MTTDAVLLANVSVFLDGAAKLVLPALLKATPRQLRYLLKSIEISSDELAPLALFEQIRTHLAGGEVIWLIGLTAELECYRPAIRAVIQAARDPAVGRSEVHVCVLFPCASVKELVPWSRLSEEMSLAVFGLSPQWRGSPLDFTATLASFRKLAQTFLFTTPSRWNQPLPGSFSRLCSEAGTYVVGIEGVDLGNAATQSAAIIEASIFSHFIPYWSERARSILKTNAAIFPPERLRRATGSLLRLSERFTGDLLADTANSSASLTEMVGELERLGRQCTGDALEYVREIVLELRGLASHLSPGMPHLSHKVNDTLESQVKRLFEIHPFPLIRFMLPSGVRPVTLGHQLESAFASAEMMVAESIRADQYEHYLELVTHLTDGMQQLDSRLPRTVLGALGMENAIEVGFLRHVPTDLSRDSREELLLLPDRVALLFYARV